MVIAYYPDDGRLWRPRSRTTTGRLIAAGVMVAGVAVIGAVAAIVALAVALRVARQEELAFEAAAEILEQRLDVRLARIEARLANLDARLQENYKTAKPLQ